MTVPFSVDYLAQRLAALDVARDAPLVAAVSGGADSLSLAHALAQIGRTVRIVHVNHHLHPDSDQWAAQVSGLAAAWQLPCAVVDVSVNADTNIEARAREARYAAIAAQMMPGDTVLTAHHQDDQALTLLLQLLRGAGPAGLAAMPARAAFGAGSLLRPLLSLPAVALTDYAAREGFAPVQDPSNDDVRFDRNYLRRHIVPVLQTRWPAFAQTLTRSAALCADADTLLQTLAQLDGANAEALNLDPARLADESRARNALRGFLRVRGVTPPPRARLTEFVRQAQTASTDSSPSLALDDGLLQVCGHHVFLTGRGSPPPNWSATLESDRPLSLPGDAGILSYRVRNQTAPSLRVTLRRGGERFVQPPARRVKSYLQGLGVLPWRRAWVPLIYRGTELVAIGDWWRSASLEGQLSWQRRVAYRLADVVAGPDFAQPP